VVEEKEKIALQLSLVYFLLYFFSVKVKKQLHKKRFYSRTRNFSLNLKDYSDLFDLNQRISSQVHQFQSGILSDPIDFDRNL
jgi:hypothetical protein